MANEVQMVPHGTVSTAAALGLELASHSKYAAWYEQNSEELGGWDLICCELASIAETLEAEVAEAGLEWGETVDWVITIEQLVDLIVSIEEDWPTREQIRSTFYRT